VFHCRKFDKLVDTSPLFFPLAKTLNVIVVCTLFLLITEIRNYPGIEVFSISYDIKTRPKHGNLTGNKLTAVWVVVFSAQEID